MGKMPEAQNLLIPPRSNSAEEATDSQYVLWAQWAGADIFSEGKIIYKYLSCTCFKIPLDNRGMVT